MTHMTHHARGVGQRRRSLLGDDESLHRPTALLIEGRARPLRGRGKSATERRTGCRCITDVHHGPRYQDGLRLEGGVDW